VSHGTAIRYKTPRNARRICRRAGSAPVRVRTVFHLRRHHRLNDVVIPKLKGLFALQSTARSMLVQSAFLRRVLHHLVAGNGGRSSDRLYARRGARVAVDDGRLSAVHPASLPVVCHISRGLFVLAAGITVVQVVANPLISMLGRPATATAASRSRSVQFAGTTIFPYVGSIPHMSSISRSTSRNSLRRRLRPFERRRPTSSCAPTWVSPRCWCWCRRGVGAPQSIAGGA